MRPAAAEQLAESIDALLVGVGVDAVVEALWDGETPTDEQPLSKTQFVDLVRGALLGTHTRYMVSQGGLGASAGARPNGSDG